MTDVEVDYSRPNKNDREIFGGLVPYGKLWRTGANLADSLCGVHFLPGFFQNSETCGIILHMTFSCFKVSVRGQIMMQRP